MFGGSIRGRKGKLGAHGLENAGNFTAARFREEGEGFVQPEERSNNTENKKY
jgi:hypothetical protein